MDVYFVVSLVVGVVSVVLAFVAIFYSYQSESKSRDYYDRTNNVLLSISEKAAVIEGTVNATQQKLVDTITDIARPQRETQEEVFMRTMLPAMLADPSMSDALRQVFVEGARQQTPSE